ncbi:MAG: sigma-70 family RNA polymerase sigma factor [Gemmatimonadales bacterium]
MPAEPTSPHTVTSLLEQARGGEPAALTQLLPLIYAELHRIAERQMRKERPDHTLQPTALVHEAFLRLVGGAPLAFEDRTHFLRTASQAMRRILVDHARARAAAKRSSALRVTLDDAIAGSSSSVLDILVLDDALTRLAAADPRWAQVVELRFFGGLEVPEVAAALGISTATVKRDWKFARAWLARELDTAQTPDA